MSIPTLAQFSALTELVFTNSPQAVLTITETRVSYANRAAIELLGLNPTGLPLINYVDASFASQLNSKPSDVAPKMRRTKFFDHYYDILPILCHETLVLFLYPPDAMYDKNQLLQDTLSLFKAFNNSAKSAFEKNQSQTLKSVLIQSGLAVDALQYACHSALIAYDFISLFEYAMNSFSELADRNLFTLSITRGKHTPLVPLDCRLMHAALVGTAFDLLRLCAKQDVLMVACSGSKTEVTLSFTCQHTKLPKELESLLLGNQNDPATVDVLQKHGTSLLLAKRIFAIHNAKFQIDHSGAGLTLTLSFPCAIQPPTLYMGGAFSLDFPTPFSLSREEINASFLDSEKV